MPAADAKPDPLVAELANPAPAAPRTEEQWHGLYVRAIETLLPTATAEQDLERVALRAGAPDAAVRRRALERALLAALAQRPAPGDRVVLLRMLALIGGEDAVPALARLLGDASPLIRESALGALEKHPSSAAGQVIVGALANARDSGWRTALLNSLGRRRDAAAGAAMVPLCRDGDEAVAGAALMNLAYLAAPEALAVLREAEKVPAVPAPVLARARLLAADRLRAVGRGDDAADLYRRVCETTSEEFLRMSALRGLSAVRPAEARPLIERALHSPHPRIQAEAIRLLVDASGHADVPSLLAGLGRLPPAAEPMFVEILLGNAARWPGNGQIRTLALKTVKGSEPRLRIVAIQALAHVGTGADVPLLAELAAAVDSREQAAAACDVLSALRAPDADAALTAAIDASAPALRAGLIRAAATRRTAVAFEALLRAADDEHAEVRLEARRALQAIPDAHAVSRLIALLLRSRSGEERGIAERALAASCGKVGDPQDRASAVLSALASADPAARCTLLPALGRIGGAQALDAVHAAMKDGDERVREAGVRALANWPDATVAPELLCLAETLPDAGLRVLTLRAAVRVLTLPSPRPAHETAALLRQTLALAERPDDQRLIFTRLPALGTPEALALALDQLSHTSRQAMAIEAALRLAERLRHSHPQAAREAVAKLRGVARDDNLLRRLDRLAAEWKQ
jgi:HEAT repeat protein